MKNIYKSKVKFRLFKTKKKTKDKNIVPYIGIIDAKFIFFHNDHNLHDRHHLYDLRRVLL